MLAASAILLYESSFGWVLVAGLAVGGLLVELSKFLLSRAPDVSIVNLTGQGAKTAVLAFVVLFVHSLAEGLAMGAGLAVSPSVGIVVLFSMAVQNIPEGIAMGAVTVPRGVPLLRAVWLAIASSLPQMIAFPAWYLFSGAPPFLPFGFGLAAGAMVWLVWRDLVPEAKPMGTKSMWIGVVSAIIVILIGAVVISATK
jgi:zinc transporter ZupT